MRLRKDKLADAATSPAYASRTPQRYRVQQDQGEYALKGCPDGDLVDYSAYAKLRADYDLLLAMCREASRLLGDAEIERRDVPKFRKGEIVQWKGNPAHPLTVRE